MTAAGASKNGDQIMWATVRSRSAPLMWMVWTIGIFIVFGLAIFFADGVPALIAPWFVPKSLARRRVITAAARLRAARVTVA